MSRPNRLSAHRAAAPARASQRQGLARRDALRIVAAVGLAVANVFGSACGKKGPPLAPLRLVPAAVTEIDARRSGGQVELRFGLPTTNANGPGQIDLGRIEIYAVTIGPGAPEPANQVLLERERLVGTIDVRPLPVEEDAEDAGDAEEQENAEKGGKPAATAPPDPRPGPGERVMFAEELTGAVLEPVIVAKPAPAAESGKPGEGAAAGAPAAAAQPPATDPAAAQPAAGQPAAAQPAAGQPAATLPEGTPPTAPPGQGAPAPAAAAQGAAPKPPPAKPAAAPVVDPVAAAAPARIYAIRGVTRGGRAGVPVRVRIPLVDPPPPPTGVAARFTETAIALDWTAPVPDLDAPPLTFNVYAAAEGAQRVNPEPLQKPAFELPIPALGKEHCLAVRSMRTVGGVPIESASSAPACTTPVDIFPPPAPGGLQAVPTAEGVNLSWEPTSAPDLGGYVLLRGESPDGTLQPLTPEPIRETTFRDATVTPGTTYVYAVVAVDKSSPPNRSERSATATVTAR